MSNQTPATPDELKPCPFCGSADIGNVSAGVAGPSTRFHAGDPIFAVNCRDCGASVPNRYRNHLVVEAWNRRAVLSATPEQPAPATPPLTDAEVTAIHRTRSVRDSLLAYFDNPNDKEAAAIVRAIQAALTATPQAAASPVAYVPYCFADTLDAVAGEYRWEEVDERPFEVSHPESWRCQPLFAAPAVAATPPLTDEQRKYAEGVAYTLRDDGDAEAANVIDMLLSATAQAAATPPAVLPTVQPDAKDAARYRWLRDVSVPPHNFYLSVPDEFHGVRYSAQEVDAAIDAALAAAPDPLPHPQQGGAL